MTKLYQNKYRIPSARLQHWDYRWAATYFITICTHDKHQHDFGKIENGEMKLSHIGVLADVFWHEIKSHAKNIELDAFIVMPNHIHGILVLYGNDNENTPPILPNSNKTIGQQRFQNIGKNSVSSIIGSYKAAVTKHARRLGFEFRWQTRFYDHIIRNDDSYDKIRNYIINNPSKWEEDKFYS